MLLIYFSFVHGCFFLIISKVSYIIYHITQYHNTISTRYLLRFFFPSTIPDSIGSDIFLGF